MALARALRVRATVRALSAKLIAAEHRLAQTADAGVDPAAAMLVAQLAAQRVLVDELEADLDARVAAVAATGAAIEARFTAALVDAAREAAAGRAMTDVASDA